MSDLSDSSRAAAAVAPAASAPAAPAAAPSSGVVSEAALASARALARSARAASRTLKALGYEARQGVLRSLAAALVEPANVAAIEEANARDVAAATQAAQAASSQAATATASAAAAPCDSSALSHSALARLTLSASKLRTLSSGLLQLANPSFVRDPVNRLLRETLLADGLVLQQRSVPLGVLLVIFESRPDVLPQLVGLSVLSANGVLLKGGRESTHTLAVLHKLCCESISSATGGQVDGRTLVGLVTGRDAVAPLLACDGDIDLVIPRGGSGLVAFVRASTRIPMLAHADGVCHVYLDKEYGGLTNLPAMIALIVDAKTDYPAACNAMETLLIHEDLTTQTAGAAGGGGDVSPAHKVLRGLKDAGVTLFAGPRALAHAAAHGAASPFAGLAAAADLHMEYGDLRACVELVSSVAQAASHIDTYGSGHTEVILTSDPDAASFFLERVDAACVFHNASSRFADGQRMGLGAEVGISTGRVHARGPVGVEGLCSTKWSLRSARTEGHRVAPFSSGAEHFIHQQREVTSDGVAR